MEKRNPRNSLQQQSRQAALCGLLAALSVVILSLGGLIPLATFACPMLAMVCLLPVVCRYGARPALVTYAAVSLLALLLCADRELALFYVFLGWYPALRDRLPRGLPGAAVKCGLFSLSMVLMYALILYLFRLEAVVEEFAAYSGWMTAGLLVLGNVTFLLFDRALGVLSPAFRRKRRR